MAYKILINSKGVPVLVEIHEPDRKLWFRSEATPADNIAALKKLTSESLSTALADESKHIAFKDEKSVWILMKKLMIVRGGNLIGQTFDLPENIGVSFEEVCRCELERIKGNTQMCFACFDPKEFKLAILTPQAKEDNPKEIMMIHDHNQPLPSYKSYKAQKFEKGISRSKALRDSVYDSSLKDEDKKKLIEKMIDELKS